MRSAPLFSEDTPRQVGQVDVKDAAQSSKARSSDLYRVAQHYESLVHASGARTAEEVLLIIGKDIEKDGIHGASSWETEVGENSSE